MSQPAEFRIPSYRDIERLAFEGRVSMVELCRRADVHPSTFRYWKSGRSTPSVAIVQALLDAGRAAVNAAGEVERSAKAARRAKPATKNAKAPKPAASKRKPRRPA